MWGERKRECTRCLSEESGRCGYLGIRTSKKERIKKVQREVENVQWYVDKNEPKKAHCLVY